MCLVCLLPPTDDHASILFLSCVGVTACALCVCASEETEIEVRRLCLDVCMCGRAQLLCSRKTSVTLSFDGHSHYARPDEEIAHSFAR